MKASRELKQNNDVEESAMYSYCKLSCFARVAKYLKKKHFRETF